MAANGPGDNTESYRRAGDLLQVQTLEEMRYLRRRLDTVIDGMATKNDLVALGSRVDSEIRALESQLGKVASDSEARLQAQRADLTALLTRHEDESRQRRDEIAERIKLNEDDVEKLQRDKLPQWFWPTAIGLLTVVAVIVGYFLHH